MQQLNLDLYVGPLSMEPKYEVFELVCKWLDKQPVGKKFGPRDIQDHVELVTGGVRRPQDGTITRYIRKYNEQGGCVTCLSRAKSLYIKDKQRVAV